MKFFKKKKKFYYAGDKAPDSLINNVKSIGGFVSVDPETKIIKEIFIP